MNIQIVEDSPAHAKVLTHYLAQVGDLNIIAISDTLEESIKAIEKQVPHIVFMDIHLKNGETSFQIIDYFLQKKGEMPCHFILLTDRKEEFANQAFDYGSIKGYFGNLGKPIHIDRLQDLMLAFRAQYLMEEKVATADIKLQSIAIINAQLHDITIPDSEGFWVLNVADIIYLKSDKSGKGSYTEFVTIHDKENTVKKRSTKSIGEYETKLKDSYFIRISRFEIVNKKFISRYHFSGALVLKTGESLQVGKAYRTTLRNAFK